LEDRAYSLLGLFDINIPLIYGEGQKAFLRLQMEILKQLPDFSIFAWRPMDARIEGKYLRIYQDGVSGVLAITPAEFPGCGAVHTWRSNLRFEEDQGQPFTVTALGIQMMRLLPAGFYPTRTYFFDLQCQEIHLAATREPILQARTHDLQTLSLPDDV
jgi:hypothetical protein